MGWKAAKKRGVMTMTKRSAVQLV
jgi:hypothetical protein